MTDPTTVPATPYEEDDSGLREVWRDGYRDGYAAALRAERASRPPVTPQADPAEPGLRAAAEAIRDHHAAPFAVNGHSLTDDCWSRFYAALGEATS